MDNNLYNTKAINDKRIALQRHINSNPVKVNRDEFTKSEDEKSRLKNLKQHWNNQMKRDYPEFTPKIWAMTSARERFPQTRKLPWK